MTEAKADIKQKNAWKKEIQALSMLTVTVIYGLFLSKESADYVKEGLRLAVGCVIPSSFPFMIISDWYVAYGAPENMRVLSRIISKLLSISPSGLGAFICGNVGGFPIGAKMCADAYSSGRIKRGEAERLMPLSNNPSCAFIIGGVGIGMWGDMKVGILLFASVLLSTVTCALIFHSECSKTVFNDEKIEQNYIFVDSVKSAGMNCVGIISFICIFSVLSGIIKKRVKNALLLTLIFSFLEVTNAVNTASELLVIPTSLGITACGFALGFGGLCVGMQSSLFASRVGLGMKKYYLIKLFEGLISASYATLIFFISGLIHS